MEKGRELDLPGRYDTDQVHVGIAWLESVAFDHIDEVGEKVLMVKPMLTGYRAPSRSQHRPPEDSISSTVASGLLPTSASVS